MKFLNVFCLNRQAEVYISLDKIVLLRKGEEGESLIEVEGLKGDVVKVATPVDELIRKINGEERVGIGFRAGR